MFTEPQQPKTVLQAFMSAGFGRPTARRLQTRTLAALGLQPSFAPRQVTFRWLMGEHSVEEIGEAMLRALDIEEKRAERALAAHQRAVFE